MNYRHAFHAGNFADVLKHAVLLELLARATARPEPLFALDTHAGAGVYDLAAAATSEAAAGIARLMAEPSTPEAFAPLKQAVRRLGPGRYPGSPRLIADALRPRDRLVACELQPDAYAKLAAALAYVPAAEAVEADGYAAMLDRVPTGSRNALVLIDPPYERGDEAARVAEAVGSVFERAGGATVCVWAPLKDLETLDALVRSVERWSPTVVELRLRPLLNPLQMNGCALLLFNVEDELASTLERIAACCATGLGEAGASSSVWRA